ncbi:MAG: amino acid permease [Candidatus Gastranaerophilales bacterium]|nr:amino acid permease [Candidatus Gastranaerophilales bacterium]
MTKNDDRDFAPNFAEKIEVGIISKLVKNLLKIKNPDNMIKQAQDGGLKKTLGAFDLIILGVGAIIGSGIFTVAGIAAIESGPSLVISMILASLACVFSALCYSEFAAMIPASGGAYTYTYATMGEFMAWIIGWVLMLEYLVGYIAVVSAWSGYFMQFIKGFSFLPQWLTNPPVYLIHDYSTLVKDGVDIATQVPHFLGIPICVNIPGILISIFIIATLIKGMQESKNMTGILVVIKIAVVAAFVITGFFYIKPENWTPFMPNGFSGMFASAFTIFFAYIGFDAIATAAEETKNPQKNLPIGIIGSLIVCTICYVLVALVLTGMVPLSAIDTQAPIASAMAMVGQNWVAGFISIGALTGLTSVLLVLMLAGTRILFSMSRDNFLPKVFQKVHPKYQTPHVLTYMVGAICIIGSLFLDIQKAADLVNFGAVAAFIVVCVAILILRKTDPNRHRPFKVPCCPYFPILGILCCGGLMLYSMSLKKLSTILFVVWVLIGIVFYSVYSYKQQRKAELETIGENNV